jgi:hypothetical protein
LKAIELSESQGALSVVVITPNARRVKNVLVGKIVRLVGVAGVFLGRAVLLNSSIPTVSLIWNCLRGCSF